MKQSVILLMILTIAGPLSAFAATLQNTDSQAYNLQIQELGGLTAANTRSSKMPRSIFVLMGAR